jgi:preprotein translocase subunit SecA
MSFLNKVLKGFLGDKKAQDLRSKKVVTKIKAVEPNIQ